MAALTLQIPLALNRPVDCVRFEVHGVSGLGPPGGDAALACHLIPAMGQGLVLQLDAAPDAALLAHLPALTNRLAAWNPSLKPVPVEHPPSQAPAFVAPAQSSAVFYTGGVDSGYELLAHRNQVDTLVYVLGFDVHSNQARLREATLAMLRASAAHYGKRLIVVDTNLRAYLDATLDWGMSHGAALATVAHVLGGAVGTFRIAGSFAPHQLHPWGSHPDLDPHWSSGRVRLLHDAGPTRLEKVRMIARDAFALRHLRVCWVNPDDAYNCGRCPKCIRTRLALALVDADGQAPFPGCLVPDEVATLGRGLPRHHPEAFFLQELCEGYASAGRRDTPLGQALRRAVAALEAAPVRLETRPPPRFVIGPARLEHDGARVRLRADVQWAAAEAEFRVSYNAALPPPRPGDALVLWFLMAAMRQGAALHVEDDVSADLIATLDEAQRVWTALPSFEGLRRVPVTVRTVMSPLPRHPHLPLAAAFGGGVDGWFTALRERERLGTLFFLHGLDQEQPDPAYRERCSGWLHEAAAALGVPLIEADTNLREVIVRTLGGRWDHTYVSGPIGFAHLLQAVASGTRIAGDLSYTELQRARVTGQYHPLYERWVGSAGMEIRFDALAWSRHEKAGWLAREHAWCLPHLWVCFARLTQGHRGGRNCGVCEKCLRTLAGFRVAGHAAAAAAAFDVPLDLARLAAVRIPADSMGEVRVLMLWSLLDALRATGADVPLQRALASAIAGSEDAWPRGPLPTLVDPVPGWRASPDWGHHLAAHGACWSEAVLGAGAVVPSDLLARDPELTTRLAAHRIDQHPGAVYRFVLAALRRRVARMIAPRHSAGEAP